MVAKSVRAKSSALQRRNPEENRNWFGPLLRFRLERRRTLSHRLSTWRSGACARIWRRGSTTSVPGRKPADRCPSRQPDRVHATNPGHRHLSRPWIVGSGSVKDLISSARRESTPQYSADGTRIAFISDRTGSDEIWISDSNGSDWRQITSFAGPAVGSPRGSPDGKWIAFDSTADGRAGIYIVGASGGAVRRITSPGVACVRPSWSQDGRWIYFGSDRNAGWQIWKTTPDGGSPIQVTRDGGREAFEAPAGIFLYYSKAPPAKGIGRIALNSDPELRPREEKVSDFARQGSWAVGGRGIYDLNATGQLMFQEFSMMRSCQIPTPGLQLGLPNLMGAVPDDRWVLLTALVRSGDGLMLVRDFQ